MTTAQIGFLNRDILRSLGVIAEDESALRRVAKYLRKIAKQISADSTLMSKEEFFARVDEAKKGATVSMQPDEDLTAFLRRQGEIKFNV